MASKYGYVSRDTANRQIDWNAIGTQVSEGITKITEDRKERREDILTKSTDYAKMLIDMPMGSNTAFNEYPAQPNTCLLYTSPSPRDRTRSRMPSSA